MTLGTKLVRAYFNFIYNSVYDFTTGKLAAYRELQDRCVNEFKFEDGDEMLCVGVGTGNEIIHILKTNCNVSIVGVDYSETALKKTFQKVLASGKQIEVFNMDAQSLGFEDGSFDKVLCLHVMDFVEDAQKVTSEIIRVLRDQGQFVITYPSDKEGVKLGRNLFKYNIHYSHDSKINNIKAFLKSIMQMVVSSIYLPLLLRSNKKSYSRTRLTALIAGLTEGGFNIDEDVVYQDYIVCGKK
ncbi:class I SAM-dependent methyltransferase [Chloroflexota bacterium]